MMTLLIAVCAATRVTQASVTTTHGNG